MTQARRDRWAASRRAGGRGRGGWLLAASLVLLVPRTAAAQCRPELADVRVVDTVAREPQLRLGRSGLLLAYARRPNDEARVVRAIPLTAGAVGTLVSGGATTAADAGMALVRVAEEAVLVRWGRSDAGGLAVEIVSPARAAAAARVVPPGSGGALVTAVAADPETVYFTVETDESTTTLFAVRDGTVRRGVLIGAADGLAVTRIQSVSPTRILVRTRPRDCCERGYQVLEVDASGPAFGVRRAAVDEMPPRLELVTQRAGRERSPWLAVLRADDRRTAILGFDDAPRFAPSEVELADRRYVVYSEGLGAATRIRMRAFLRLHVEVEGTSLAISDPASEAGAASADSYAGRAFVAWTEGREDASRLLLAEIRCR